MHSPFLGIGRLGSWETLTTFLLLFLIAFGMILVVGLTDFSTDLSFDIFGPIPGVVHVLGFSFASLFNATFISAFDLDDTLLI